jgi:hypothetical protein
MPGVRWLTLLEGGKVKMRNRITLIVSIVTLLLCLSPNVYSQTRPGDFVLSIAVEHNTFSLPETAKVKIKVENKSGHTATKDALRGLAISLTRYRKDAERCRWGDCFRATYRLSSLKELKSGEAFEAEIDLADLYWNDEISSQIDFNEPKNMAQVILAGSYYLSVSLYFPAANSTKREPRAMEIRSNEISVKVL